MSEQKQKMYAPEEIPKYLRRKGVNVPLPERKERKKREPKAKVAEPDKNELANLIGSMLEEATLTVEGSAPMSSRPKVQPPPEVPTDAPPVVKPKRTRASKTDTLLADISATKRAGPKPSAEPRKTKTLRGPRSVANTLFAGTPETKNTPKTRAPNPWQVHLQDYRAKNPTISYKQAMADARESYTKV